ncbi:MAG: hypothetical protein KDK99_06590 [Verrucomicrobiales bacterium]|nr:hypothetical protein [Verrucomicrobiales bacterium]
MQPDEPSTPTPIQQLIRLKRYEQPSDETLEGFVADFRERQRREMLNQSARGLLWERVTTYWENLSATPKWGIAGLVGAAAALLLWFGLQPAVETPVEGGGLAENATPAAAGGEKERFEVDAMLISVGDTEEATTEAPFFLSRHNDGGFVDDQREQMADVNRTPGVYLDSPGEFATRPLKKTTKQRAIPRSE